MASEPRELYVPPPAYLAMSDEAIAERLDEIIRSVVDYSRDIGLYSDRIAAGEGTLAQRNVWRDGIGRLRGRRDNLYAEARVLTIELDRRRDERKARLRAERQAEADASPEVVDLHATARVLALLKDLKRQRRALIEAQRLVGKGEQKRAAQTLTLAQQMTSESRTRQYKENIYRAILTGEVAVLHPHRARKFLANNAGIPAAFRDAWNAAELARGYERAQSSDEVAALVAELRAEKAQRLAEEARLAREADDVG
jgi:hypothetical protein